MSLIPLGRKKRSVKIKENKIATGVAFNAADCGVKQSGRIEGCFFSYFLTCGVRGLIFLWVKIPYLSVTTG